MSLCKYSIPSTRNITGCNNTKEMARSSTLLGPQFDGESRAGLGSGGKAKASTSVLPSNLALFLSLGYFDPVFSLLPGRGKLLLARIFNELTSSLFLSGASSCLSQATCRVRTQFHTEMIFKGFRIRTPTPARWEIWTLKDANLLCSKTGRQSK